MECTAERWVNGKRDNKCERPIGHAGAHSYIRSDDDGVMYVQEFDVTEVIFPRRVVRYWGDVRELYEDPTTRNRSE
jgi:hypothetical protein